MALLLITHDLGVVRELCERAIVLYAGRIAEVASVDQLFDDPRHPYTAGLAASNPSIASRRARLPQIPGGPPNPAEVPPGLPVLAPLPGGRRALRHRGAAARPGRRGTAGRLSPEPRARRRLAPAHLGGSPMTDVDGAADHRPGARRPRAVHRARRPADVGRRRGRRGRRARARAPAAAAPARRPGRLPRLPGVARRDLGHRAAGDLLRPAGLRQLGPAGRPGALDRGLLRPRGRRRPARAGARACPHPGPELGRDAPHGVPRRAAGRRRVRPRSRPPPPACRSGSPRPGASVRRCRRRSSRRSTGTRPPGPGTTPSTRPPSASSTSATCAASCRCRSSPRARSRSSPATRRSTAP